jgi:hypothetical protein
VPDSVSDPSAAVANVMPFGSPFTCQVYGAWPPDADTVALYGTPCVATGRLAVVM